MSIRKEDQRGPKLSKVYSKDFIPLFAGRPDRERSIGKNDQIDLTIILNTTDSVDAFLEKMKS